MKKRVAIIGAGVSGLPAIKCCLDEDLEPVCFEKSGDIGGIWNYEEALKTPNATSVMSSTVSNTSKEMSCYSDFPFPNDYPLFVTHEKMLAYLRLYAKKFDLLKYINFHYEVLKVQQTKDFSQSGNWSVTCKDVRTGIEKQDIFNAVLMCSGAFSDPRKTSFEGQEKFTGRIFHSRDYKSYHGLENKKVVVVGMKSTGTDIAAELSGVGSQVYLSSRRGTWVVEKLFDKGVPADCALSNRIFLSVFQTLPVKLAGKIMKSGINKRFNHSLYGMEPKHLPGLESGSLTINNNLPDRIISGRVVIKPTIRRFTETSIVFEDNSVVENVDAVILATGYRIQLPYLDSGLFNVKQDNVDLYRTMFAPDIHPSTIALIAGPFVTAGIMPFAEMQCRVATRVFKGDVKLPDEATMFREIRERRRQIDRKRKQLNYEEPEGEGGYMFDYYLPAMTTLSKTCECHPTFSELLAMDIRLAWHYLFGPAVPAQFRLCGHGAWSGAKETVLSSSQRAMEAFPPIFQPKSAKNNSDYSQIATFVILFILFVLFAFAGNYVDAYWKNRRL